MWLVLQDNLIRCRIVVVAVAIVVSESIVVGEGQ
jgi:hypothetical protein